MQSKIYGDRDNKVFDEKLCDGYLILEEHYQLKKQVHQIYEDLKNLAGVTP